jgi:hypothetical protein
MEADMTDRRLFGVLQRGKSIRLWRLALGAALLLAAPVDAFAQRASRAQAPALAHGPAFPDFAQQEAFRRLADEFIAAAVAGDTVKMTAMISPSIAAKSGREAVARYLADQVLPFFAQYKELGNSITIAGTQGTPGNTFYMYMVSKENDLRPFVVQVIEEGSADVVSNVLVDNFVEGRHCAFAAGAWQCPDFR